MSDYEYSTNEESSSISSTTTTEEEEEEDSSSSYWDDSVILENEKDSRRRRVVSKNERWKMIIVKSLIILICFFMFLCIILFVIIKRRKNHEKYNHHHHVVKNENFINGLRYGYMEYDRLNNEKVRGTIFIESFDSKEFEDVKIILNNKNTTVILYSNDLEISFFEGGSNKYDCTASCICNNNRRINIPYLYPILQSLGAASLAAVLLYFKDEADNQCKSNEMDDVECKIDEATTTCEKRGKKNDDGSDKYICFGSCFVPYLTKWNEMEDPIIVKAKNKDEAFSVAAPAFREFCLVFVEKFATSENLPFNEQVKEESMGQVKECIQSFVVNS